MIKSHVIPRFEDLPPPVNVLHRKSTTKRHHLDHVNYDAVIAQLSSTFLGAVLTDFRKHVK